MQELPLGQAGPVQLQLSGGGSSPPSWYFSFVLVTIAPLVIFIGIGRFSRMQPWDSIRPPLTIHSAVSVDVPGVPDHLRRHHL